MPCTPLAFHGEQQRMDRSYTPTTMITAHAMFRQIRMDFWIAKANGDEGSHMSGLLMHGAVVRGVNVQSSKICQ